MKYRSVNNRNSIQINWSSQIVSGCISYGRRDEEKQGGNKSRGEQDSTSQDSATDSGLCPDSEGMSPTPHSDDERQRVHMQLPNGHLEPAEDPTPTESCDFESTLVVKEELTNCDSPVAETNAGLSATKTEVFDGLKSTVEETLNNHDTNLFNKFQECSAESNIVSSSGTELKSKLEHSNVFKNNDLGSIVSSESVLLHERNIYGTETLESEDNDNFEDFQGFSENKNGTKPISEICIEDEDDSFQDFKECVTEIENLNISTKSYPLETNSENHVSCSSEIQSSEQLKLKNQNCIPEKLCFENNADTSNGNEEPKDTREVDSLQLEDEDDDFSDFTDFKANLSTFNEIIETDETHSLSEHHKQISELKGSLDGAEQCLDPPQQDESEDEFSNFADFSSSSCAFASAHSSNSVESTPYIPSKPGDDTDLRTDSEFQVCLVRLLLKSSFKLNV